MRDKIKKIRHFEIVGDMEEFRDAWSRYTTGKFEKDLRYSDFLKKYLHPKLGREVKKEETRGISCARIYYDEKDNMTWMALYDGEERKAGLNLELRLPSKRKSGKSIKIGPEPEMETLSVTYPIDRPDINEILSLAYGDILELKRGMAEIPKNVVLFSDYILFRKIPITPYDSIPLSTYEGPVCTKEYSEYGIWDVEGLLYTEGYKVVDKKRIDIDGVVNRGIHRTYNSEGLLVKEERYFETPWGDVITWRVMEWIFELKNRLIFQHSFIPGENLDMLHRYELDEKNRLRQIRRYHRPEKITKSMLRDPHTPEGMIFTEKVEYEYDNEGRFLMTKNTYGKSIYNYDSKGRLLMTRSYDKRGRLDSCSTYEYPSEKRVTLTTQYKQCKPDDLEPQED